MPIGQKKARNFDPDSRGAVRRTMKKYGTADNFLKAFFKKIEGKR